VDLRPQEHFHKKANITQGIHTVVFNEWEWDQDEIHKLLDEIARLIRDIAFQTRLNLPGIFQEELTK